MNKKLKHQRLLATESSLLKDIKRDKILLMMLIPGIVFFIVFKYVPMGGIVIAFQDYSVNRGIWKSQWVGLYNFKRAFMAPEFFNVLKNTLRISLYKLILGFPAPIILALFLNEMRNIKFKRTVQTIIYLPHFVSWVVIAGIMVNMLSPSRGIVAPIYALFGREAPYFMISKEYITGILVLSEMWKTAGWGTIIYLAALSTVDPNLYEAAIIDGANRIKQTIYITIPSISSVVILLLILNIGSLLNAGFEQVQVMMNDYIRPVIDIFDTFVYRRGIQKADYSYATAVGLFNSVVSLVLIVLSDRFAKTFGEEGLL